MKLQATPADNFFEESEQSQKRIVIFLSLTLLWMFQYTEFAQRLTPGLSKFSDL